MENVSQQPDEAALTQKKRDPVPCLVFEDVRHNNFICKSRNNVTVVIFYIISNDRWKMVAVNRYQLQILGTLV